MTANQQMYDHYRVDRQIGQGGMGVVYAATDTRLNRTVALKVISTQLASDPDFVTRFLREADILARLDSPHVITIYDSGEANGSPYIASQFVSGGDPGGLTKAGGPLPPDLALTICAQMADALADAHRVGVVHRDVKPSNVLLRDPDAPELHAYLCDFGIAATDNPDGLTRPGSVAGSWGYLAPERVDGRAATPASDIYALGCLLWACLTGGQPPYTGSDYDVGQAHLSGPIPQLPSGHPQNEQINQLLTTALAKQPAHRFADARQLRDALLAARTSTGAAALATHATPGAVAANGSGPSRGGRKVRPLIVAAVLVLALVGALAAFALTRGDEPSEQADDAGSSDSSDSSDDLPEPLPPEERARIPDYDGDGTTDLALHTFEWTRVFASDGEGAFGEEQDIEGAPAVLADIDGDGRTDSVMEDGIPYQGESAEYAIRFADGRTAVSTYQMPGRKKDYLSYDLRTGDVDGNGTTDLIFIGTGNDKTGEGTIQVARGSEEGLGELEEWYQGFTGDTGVIWHTADFDGDGRTDISLTSSIEGSNRGRQIEVALSTGSKWKVAGRPTRMARTYSTATGDVDGDGADDLVVVKNPDTGGLLLKVRSFNGKQFSPAEFWLEVEEASAGDSADDFDGVLLGDYNGDGKDDALLMPYGDGKRWNLFVALSDGSAFAEPTQWASIPCGDECTDSITVLGPESEYLL